MGTTPVVPISAIEHHEYCPRQCALIHVDGVWRDNEFTVKGTRAHHRVDTAPSRQERGRLLLRGIPLWSEVHGLNGRADAVEVFDHGVRPVEYKSGSRHGLTADLQLCAQALCLEEMLGHPIPDGDIWYGATRRRHLVVFDEALRSHTLAVVAAIGLSILSGSLPEAVDDERCTQCQLEPVCLPQITARPANIDRYIAREVMSCAT